MFSILKIKNIYEVNFEKDRNHFSILAKPELTFTRILAIFELHNDAIQLERCAIASSEHHDSL